MEESGPVGLTEEIEFNTLVLPPHLAREYEVEKECSHRRRRLVKKGDLQRSCKGQRTNGSDDSPQGPDDDDNDDGAAARTTKGWLEMSTQEQDMDMMTTNNLVVSMKKANNKHQDKLTMEHLFNFISLRMKDSTMDNLEGFNQIERVRFVNLTICSSHKIQDQSCSVVVVRIRFNGSGVTEKRWLCLTEGRRFATFSSSFGLQVAGPARDPRKEGVQSVDMPVVWRSLQDLGSSSWIGQIPMESGGSCDPTRLRSGSAGSDPTLPLALLWFSAFKNPPLWLRRSLLFIVGGEDGHGGKSKGEGDLAWPPSSFFPPAGGRATRVAAACKQQQRRGRAAVAGAAAARQSSGTPGRRRRRTRVATAVRRATAAVAGAGSSGARASEERRQAGRDWRRWGGGPSNGDRGSSSDIPSSTSSSPSRRRGGQPQRPNRNLAQQPSMFVFGRLWRAHGCGVVVEQQLDLTSLTARLRGASTGMSNTPISPSHAAAHPLVVLLSRHMPACASPHTSPANSYLSPHHQLPSCIVYKEAQSNLRLNEKFNRLDGTMRRLSRPRPTLKLGLFVPPLGDYKHFVYMGVNDGVFVPPSDVTRCGGYINVRDRVFVPPSDVYKLVGSSMLEAGCLCLRRAFTDHFPNAEDGTPTGAKDFSSARAAYLSSRTDTLYARARECEKRLRGGIPAGVPSPAEVFGGTGVEAKRERRGRWRTGRGENLGESSVGLPWLLVDDRARAHVHRSRSLDRPTCVCPRFLGTRAFDLPEPFGFGRDFELRSGREFSDIRGSTMPRKGRDKSGQGGRSGQSSRVLRRTENDVERTDDPMPCFTLSPVRVDDLDRLEGSVGPCVRGPLEEPSLVEGTVDVGRIDHSGLIYPKHFPLDEHLLPFIQNFMPANWDGPAGLLATERAQLEQTILAGRDSMMGTCSPHHPSFPLDHEAQAHFPDTALLGLFAPEPARRVIELQLSQGQWEVQGLPKTGVTFTGHTLPPSGRDFVQDGYDRSCFLDRILGGATSWYDRWSIVSSHRFRFGATEWLMGILYHYHKMLERVSLLEAVVAALHSYPCNTGLLQALAERFNWRFNTFDIAEGETSLDLWALHRISGLPISGQFYEEVCLSDLDRDRASGAGSYYLSHSFRYLARVWHDLARCGRSDCPSASKGTVRNPRRLPDCTHLAAYLVYWLCTFALPFGEEGNIRPEAIYPACILASGVQLALAPAALANIFRGLGELTSSPSPRDKSITLATQYLGAWAGFLLPELCHTISLERPSMPLIFMFRNRPEREQQKQLREARRRLSFVPVAGQSGLDLACCSLGFRPWVEEGQGGRVYRLPHHAAPVATLRKDWLCCIRPSVLLFCKGSLLFMEPYFPHRFARNLGRDPAPEFFIPELRHEGRVGILYARWWSRYNQAFREHADDIKKAERDYLSRAGAPVSTIAPKFLQREFADIAKTVTTMGRRRAAAQAASMAGSEASAGALKPLSRPESSSAASKVRGEPPLVYFWWRHFLLDCGYTLDAALTNLVLPSVTRAWERHLQHSIIRVGPREFISWIESGTTLRHFWDAIAEAGKAVKVPFDRVVLRPTFSVAPRESFIPEKDLPKRDAPSARKRRASEEAGPSQPAARGRTPEPPSPAVAGTSASGGDELAEDIPREDVAPQGDEDYNPTFDQTPSPEGAGLPLVPSTEPGTFRWRPLPQRVLSTWPGPCRLETQHPHYRPFTTCYCLGRRRSYPAFPTLSQAYSRGLVGSNPFTARWTQPGIGLDSAHDKVEQDRPGSGRSEADRAGIGEPAEPSRPVAVTSAVVLPTASPPEEGEVARGIAGDADGGYFFHSGEPSLSISSARRLTGRERRRVPLCLSLDPSSLADGAEIAAEMMESSPPGAVLPPAVGTLHLPEGGDSASLPFDTQAVSGGLPPPSSSEAPLERPSSFPGHGISWPDAIQRSRVHESEGMLDFYIASTRAVMEESSPPSVDVVRDFLERSTVSYHLMGCPRDPWMAAVDALWSEVGQRHQEAARHRAQELAAEVALAEQRYEALCLRRGGAVSRAESLSARHASCYADIATLRRTLEEVSSRFVEHEAASLVLAEGVAAANAEVAAIERECVESRAALSALQANLADSRRGGAM
ncbi:hypothetical protein Taro_011077 [Colocasia esculenta]|uniref:Aminotransferase-like plant mobile domain-containing protein n=1 Tax=Colocasia esculenta TaxID=4460 RepID=A0A843U9Y8_COLES|nr:hypothetical protein [Colocasia esculenta]